MRRALPLALGLLALMSTIALICDCVVLAVHVSSEPLVRTTSLISATLEAIVWAMLSWFATTTVSKSLSSLLRRCPTTHLAISFGCATLACVLAAAASVANVVCLDNTRQDDDGETPNGAFLIASSVILAITFVCQVTFLAVYYLVCRRWSLDRADTPHTDDLRLSPKFRVKSVPYNCTRPSMAENRGMTSMESVDMSSLDGKRSPVQMTSSPRPSFSQSIYPSTSKTRLLSTKEKQRLPSLDSNAYRNSVDDHDAWDALSGYSRHTQDTSPLTNPKHRFLETIPASPVVADSPSFDSLPDLEPPAPIRQRSRSYSPAARKPRQLTQSPNVSSNELNIHPLFRSDSPTPPPVATPGTSVMASPDAGKVIAHRPSNPSLRRVRSSSLASTSSPLSRRSSFEAPSLKKPVDEQGSILEVDEDEDTETEELTSPIPEFVMGAGSRSSLTRYNSKKQEGVDEEPQR